MNDGNTASSVFVGGVMVLTPSDFNALSRGHKVEVWRAVCRGLIGSPDPEGLESITVTLPGDDRQVKLYVTLDGDYSASYVGDH